MCSVNLSSLEVTDALLTFAAKFAGKQSARQLSFGDPNRA